MLNDIILKNDNSLCAIVDFLICSNNITYIYSAAGEKLAKKKMKDNTYQYYAESMVYDNAKALSYILFEEGKVNKSSTVYIYEYHIKDHLGNTRVAFKSNGSGTTVDQVAEYYLFGSNYTPLSQAGCNNYLYNGKLERSGNPDPSGELQRDSLSGVNLDWYDYGARFYDPMIGRFSTVDPKAEAYSFQSPFAYAANNPIIYIDHNGEGPREFLKGLGSSITAAITYGIQGGVEVKVIGRHAVSLYGNAGSKDLIGVRDGSLTHIAQENSPTRYSTSLGFGNFGTSTEVETTKSTETEMHSLPGTDAKLPVEVDVEKGAKTTSVSGFGLVGEATHTAEIRTDKSTGEKTVKTTEPSLSTSTAKVDIGSLLDIKLGIPGVGIDFSIDMGKIYKAFDELNK